VQVLICELPSSAGETARCPVSEEELASGSRCTKKWDVLREAKTDNCLVHDARYSAWFRRKATESLVRRSPRLGDFLEIAPGPKHITSNKVV
jgi:hypothetical protein